MSTGHPPASDRVTLHRGVSRGDHDPTTVVAILRAGTVAHVGLGTADGPIVLPMAYGCTEHTLYLHGAVGNALLRGSRDQEICATVTLLDGLVIARSPFHNSMNYRCVVVRGRGRLVTEPDEHLQALRIITDHVVENWDHGRPPSASEIRRTQVIALPLDECSAKVRRGDPVDEPDDVDGPHWAGVVPITSTFGAPRPAADLRTGASTPTHVAALSDHAVSP
ncbi:pyridoxamine 5'-phosphate oxidase family protein [soil metagenome]